MKKVFTFIDLFAGIGGFKMALTNNGGFCVGFSEVNKDAINAYCENYQVNPKSNLGDITKVKDLPRHDILTAGVPCQSWSIAGKNLGFDDDRGQLWNDTIYLLNKSRPKAFIFENVKGLVDPRNKEALSYICERIRLAGYCAKHFVINSHDYGVAQNRIRIYIIGFKEQKFLDNFSLPEPFDEKETLADVLGLGMKIRKNNKPIKKDLFGNEIQPRQMSLSSKNGFNDYFLFNDLRNGHTTIHSWDIKNTSARQKEICLLLLKNRRKSQFGPLDGNPLSLKQFQSLDSTISQAEIDDLIELSILKKVGYVYEILDFNDSDLTNEELELLNLSFDNFIVIDKLKTERSLKVKRISISKTIESLIEKKIIKCTEERYEFKNTKISSGL
ncbi:MAG: DNA (cytosine-5-)-methyltransferase, partial [Bacteroidota bacterium]